ncbi:MAG: hypothetical protein M9905_17475 [Rhizobiaceae bacterium]|nr:hypothetical protein [Rhizobiaceae bacterium]
MERIVKGHVNQIFTSADVNTIGESSRASLDHVVRDAITDQAGYIQFQVVESGPAEVTVAPGRLYRNGEVFARDDEGGVTIDLSTLLPAVTRRIVTIVVWGNTIDTATQPRTFILDPVTRSTEARVVSTESRRVAYVDRVAGVENVDPQPPALDANVLGVAYVTLTPTGIESIEMIAANRLISVKRLDTRLTLVEKRLDLAGSRIDTLGTDIAGLAQQLRGRAPMGMVTSLAADFARTKRLADLPDDYMAWAADNFQREDLSDTEHGDYDALVEEGLHFPDAALARSALALTNPLDERITVVDNMVFPRAIDVVRLSVRGRDSEVALATHTSTMTEYIQKTRTRTEVQTLGQYETPAYSGDSWTTRYGHQDYYGLGEQIVFVERVNPQTNDKEVWEYNWSTNIVYDPERYNGAAHPYGYGYELDTYWRHYIVKTINEPYSTAVTHSETVQGFQVGQTFLNAQEGALRKVNLFFTRKAGSGDVHLFVTEIDATGKPNTDAVLAKATLAASALNADPAGETETTFDFGNVSLVKGRRYGLWAVSQGSHWLARVHGEKYAQGAFFQRNGADWIGAAGDIDLAFELVFSGYDQTRVEVQLNPVTLAGGIGYLEINADTAVPDGTGIIFEMNPGTGWVAMPGATDNPAGPLASHPALVQLRAVLIGTTDAMPGFGIGPTRSCVTVSRGDTSFVHISTERTLPAAADTIEVVLRAAHWDGDAHSLAVKLLTGVSFTTVETADAATDMPEPQTPASLKTKKFIFNVSPAIDSYKIRIEGASSDQWKLFEVFERTDVAYAS